FGAFAGYEFGGGATLAVPAGPVLIGASFDATGGKNYNFQIASAIAKSLMAGRVDASTLLLDTSSFRLAPGVPVAVGLLPVVGLWAHARYAYQRATQADMSSSSNALEGGAALSLDLHGALPIPIGILAAYNLYHEFPAQEGAEGSSTHQVGGGIF